MKHGLNTDENVWAENYSTHESFELDCSTSEVDEQANFDPRCLELVQQLRFLFRIVCLRRFQFDKDAFIHENIRFVETNLLAFEVDSDFFFDWGLEPAKAKFNVHCPL